MKSKNHEFKNSESETDMTTEEKRALIEKLSRETASLCRLQKQISEQLKGVLQDVQKLRDEVGLNEGRE